MVRDTRGLGRKCPFEFINRCTVDASRRSVVADLDGTLLRGRSSFPYFFLIALEAGSLVRAAVLVLVAPLVWLTYHLVSESVGVQTLIFVAFAGLPVHDIRMAARAVLPRFYARDVHPGAWRPFAACAAHRCIVTANPHIMVEPFATEQLGAHKVLGTEIQITRGGRATGLVCGPGVLVGIHKRNAVKAEFGNTLPDLGMGDRITDYPFLSLCKEGYIVPPTKVEAVPMSELVNPVIFHDGRLAVFPTPGVALLVLLWFPLGLLLGLVRMLMCTTIPMRYMHTGCWLMGIHIEARGNPPPVVKKVSWNKNGSGNGVLFVCSHRTLLDPVILSAVLRRCVTTVTYSLSRVSEAIAPIPTVRLTRDRAKDEKRIRELLAVGDLAICPEGTTCREPYLLRFSALFAELTDRIVLVAVDAPAPLYHGSTVRGWKCLDILFFCMNPRPVYYITFLGPLSPDQTVVGGGKSAIEVANHVQQTIASALGFQCTPFTRKDKYRALAGNDGYVSASHACHPTITSDAYN